MGVAILILVGGIMLNDEGTSLVTMMGITRRMVFTVGIIVLIMGAALIPLGNRPA